MDNQLLVMVIGGALSLFFQLYQNLKFSSFLLLVMAISTPFFFRPKLLLAMAIHSLFLLSQLSQSLESRTFLLFFKLRVLNSLIVNDGDSSLFYPLSIFLKLKALSFVVDVSELRVLNFLVVSNGDPPPLPPFSTFLKFQVLSFLVVGNRDPPHVFPFSILLKLKILIFLVVFEFKTLSFLAVGDGDPTPLSPPSTFSELKTI